MALSLGSRNFITGIQQAHEPPEDHMFVVAIEIDFSAEFVAADVPVSVLIHPVDSRLSKLYHSVRTVEGSTMTYDIGDDTTADVYVNGADGNASTVGVVHPTADVKSTANLITVTPKNNAETMVLYIECEFTKAAGVYS
jgi:hypothetical protein